MIIMCACNLISPSANNACMRTMKYHQFYSSGHKQSFRKQELKTLKLQGEKDKKQYKRFPN